MNLTIKFKIVTDRILGYINNTAFNKRIRNEMHLLRKNIYESYSKELNSHIQINKKLRAELKEKKKELYEMKTTLKQLRINVSKYGEV